MPKRNVDPSTFEISYARLTSRADFVGKWHLRTTTTPAMAPHVFRPFLTTHPDLLSPHPSAVLGKQRSLALAPAPGVQLPSTTDIYNGSPRHWSHCDSVGQVSTRDAMDRCDGNPHGAHGRRGHISQADGSSWVRRDSKRAPATAE